MAPLKPRYATLRTLYGPKGTVEDTQVLDADALVFFFPSPESVTGEDVLELHVHGGIAVVKAVLAAIPKTIPIPKGQAPTVRYAEPGEFTRRAFYNNRLDLTQVEALGDTLSAETEQQRRLAVRCTSSALAERYETWRQKLLYARGELEALIDFSEDQHFDESPATLCASVARQVQQLKAQLQANIESASRGELLRNGINIALVGTPNAGKSSLLNQIVGREAAIVSQEAGTTRDVVAVSIDIGGYLCRFGDPAGLRNAASDTRAMPISDIEKEGMRRAKQRALTADVVIVLLSVRDTQCCTGANLSDVEIGDEVQSILQQLDLCTQRVICVLNKADLFEFSTTIQEICAHFSSHPSLSPFLTTPIYAISCKLAPSHPDQGGIPTLLAGLTNLFATMTSPLTPHTPDNSAWTESLGATERQRTLLHQCLEHLDAFLAQVNYVPPPENEADNKFIPAPGSLPTDTDPETDIALAAESFPPDIEPEPDIVLAAESLRAAADCLARITGRGAVGNVEEVLGVVFEKFCVGK